MWKFTKLVFGSFKQGTSARSIDVQFVIFAVGLFIVLTICVLMVSCYL